ncbi:MAG: DUF2141 domain-containing protein [Treponema sp.]|nr:DUF2141 domain-containing protein [Treponema sp.]
MMFNLKKIILTLIIAVILTMNLSADNVQFTFEVTNVVVNDGKVYLAIFFNAEEFRKEEPTLAYELDSNRTVVSQIVSLPPGHYLFSAFQDRNGNQKLDYNFIGIPRELVGISNYDGKGFPSKNFDRQKVLIDSKTEKISIGLYKF